MVRQEAQFDWLAAHKTQRTHRVSLKMNSDMNCLGFKPAAYFGAGVRLNTLPQVDEITLMTHFSDADGGRGIAHQVAAFDATTLDPPGERSLANGAAILRQLTGCGIAADRVRAGTSCDGSAPDQLERGIGHWKLRPAMTLRSRQIATPDPVDGC